jgi:hypothetical protein
MTAYGKAGTIAEEALSAIRFVHHYMYNVLCTGAFLYVYYSFLLKSNKFCDLSLLRWGVGGGGA